MFKITAHVRSLPVGSWRFGQLQLTPNRADIAEAHFPVAVRSSP